MTQTADIGHPIQHLGDADLVAIRRVFHTKIAGSQRAFQSVFNGGGFDNFGIMAANEALGGSFGSTW